MHEIWLLSPPAQHRVQLQPRPYPPIPAVRPWPYPPIPAIGPRPYPLISGITPPQHDGQPPRRTAPEHNAKLDAAPDDIDRTDALHPHNLPHVAAPAAPIPPHPRIPAAPFPSPLLPNPSIPTLPDNTPQRPLVNPSAAPNVQTGPTLDHPAPTVGPAPPITPHAAHPIRRERGIAGQIHPVA